MSSKHYTFKVAPETGFYCETANNPIIPVILIIDGTLMQSCDKSSIEAYLMYARRILGVIDKVGWRIFRHISLER